MPAYFFFIFFVNPFHWSPRNKAHQLKRLADRPNMCLIFDINDKIHMLEFRHFTINMNISFNSTMAVKHTHIV